jgi:hypothetical protein
MFDWFFWFALGVGVFAWILEALFCAWLFIKYVAEKDIKNYLDFMGGKNNKF